MYAPRQEELRELVLAFVDEQSGLTLDDGRVNAGADVYETEIILWSVGAMSREEWQDEGEELVQLLGRKGFGLWEVIGTGRRSVTLERVPE